MSLHDEIKQLKERAYKLYNEAMELRRRAEKTQERRKQAIGNLKRFEAKYEEFLEKMGGKKG